MTSQERKVLNKLVEAHNAFVTLPIQHPDDQREWATKLHDLQRMVMARLAVKENPDMFYQHKP